ncbi:anti-sigma factor [Pedobacter sp. HMWF019]|uniref:FecR family protein n=1 Tax=Pedobacter sp. HMWF019 TaxID=2056856 RepID=UPI000D3C8038|nr:FecR family protein [Pedobacter sp. HMWF019]PTS94987.1 anti-sigma factor [Pedobacter sp. HMWF019]
MQKINLQNLLEKFRNGQIEPEELVLLEIWYLQWQPSPLKVEHEDLEIVKEEVWQSLSKLDSRPEKQRRWIGIAAAIIFLAGFLSLFYFAYHAKQSVKAEQALVKMKNHDFRPGGNRAFLILSNGKSIQLTDTKSGKIADQNGMVVSKTAKGQLVYDHSTNNSYRNEGSKLTYNTVSTPRGGEYQLILSDGTKVWLNAASSITYPVSFYGEERSVVVNGEAYFEVAHNQRKPFKVLTGNQEITVLGTHFNVKGYSDDAGITTTLVSGSVKIRNLTSSQSDLLHPGEQATVFKDKGAISIAAVNSDVAVSWKNGYFLFDGQGIESIMKMLSRWYDLDVDTHLYKRHDKFGGTFSRSSNLLEILKNLEQIGQVHFKIENKKIIVSD